MSIFDKESEGKPDQNSNDQNNQDSDQKSFLERLVETKGETWKDPEVIAKGKIEADNHIRELTRQLDEMREDLSKQEYSKELLEALKQNKVPAPGGGSNEGESKENTGKSATGDTTLSSEDALKDLVEKQLSEREQKAKRDANLTAVSEGMESKFGTEANKVLGEKAESLGMSVSRLQEIAEESPSAFFTLIGEPEAAKQPIIKNGSVRTEGGNFTGSSERDWKFYQDLRRKNRREYYSKEVQKQLMADRLRLGDKFGM